MGTAPLSSTGYVAPEGLSLLREARQLVGMPVAFLSQFVDERRVIVAVDAQGAVPFAPGDSDVAEDTYCQRIVQGVLPQAIPDTSADPVAAAMPVTTELKVGSHLGVPVVLADGTLFGTLCAYSPQPAPVDERQTAILALVARSMTQYLAPTLVTEAQQAASRQAVYDLLAAGSLSAHFQPIVSLSSGDAVAAEALARFPAGSVRTPQQWFAEAASAGVGVLLESAALVAAAEGLTALPEHVALSVNVSAQMILDPSFACLLARLPPERIVLELTGHDPAASEALCTALAPFRARGLRLAVDEFGAGYTSMRSSGALNPDWVKLDRSVIRDVDADRDRRALCRAIVTYAKTLGALVVAEGVETAEELAAVHRLGVDYVQGYHLARPGPLPELALTGLCGQPQAGVLATPPREQVVQLIRELSHAGASAHTVAARLNQMGERTPLGARWHVVSVRAELERARPRRLSGADPHV